MREDFLKRIATIPQSNLVWIDESGVNRYMHREYARSLRGSIVFGDISGQRFARESVISGLQGGKLIAPMCFQGTCNTALFNTWLKEVLMPELKPGQIIILDNATFHRSKESQQIVEAGGCELLFLPPYSPDLNPIEKCWANMKRRLREILPKFRSFTDAFDEAILSFSI